MKKLIMTLILGALSFSVMAREIICSSGDADVQITLGLSDNFSFPLNKAEFRVNGKLKPINDYEFGIQTNREKNIQVLIYKFKTLKRTHIAKKNTHAVLNIKQIGSNLDELQFYLQAEHEASIEFKLEETSVTVDLNCQAEN